MELRDRSLFIRRGGGGGGGWRLGEKFKKIIFFIKTPLNKAKKNLGPPYFFIGELFQCRLFEADE